MSKNKSDFYQAPAIFQLIRTFWKRFQLLWSVVQLENISWWGKNILGRGQTSVWGVQNILN